MTHPLKLPLVFVVSFVLTANAFTQSQLLAQSQPLRVEHYVHVKGQEETVIRAFGIVSGLNGTGDDVKNYSPLANAILTQLSRSGMFSGTDARAISSTRNSALVEVTVRIPAAGARSGQMLNCTVYSVGNAKSLANGVLSMTTLSSPLQQDENSQVQGMAWGRVAAEQSPTVGRIVNGCRLTADFMNPYIGEGGLITLVLKSEHARPSMANKIAEAINFNPEFQALSMRPASAVNSHTIAVRLPTTYFSNPMDFVEQILKAEVSDVPPRVPRVMINERAGIVSIDVDVEVRPTAITYLNYVADMEPELAAGELEQFPRQFVDIDTDTKFRQMNGETVTNLKLKALQASLNALQATPQDVIEIIKVLHAQGAIVGDVVFMD